MLAHSVMGPEDDRSAAPLELRRGVAIVNSPLVHIGGVFRVLQCVSEGRPFVLLERFELSRWTDAVRKYRPRTVSLVPAALRALAPGGVAVCGGIHMSDIPAFPYDILWRERSVRSVANLTRRDAEEFLALAPQIPISTTTRRYKLSDANAALDDLRAGQLSGAAVLVPD